jgi:hypothetical protein
VSFRRSQIGPCSALPQRYVSNAKLRREGETESCPIDLWQPCFANIRVLVPSGRASQSTHPGQFSDRLSLYLEGIIFGASETVAHGFVTA